VQVAFSRRSFTRRPAGQCLCRPVHLAAGSSCRTPTGGRTCWQGVRYGCSRLRSQGRPRPQAPKKSMRAPSVLQSGRQGEFVYTSAMAAVPAAVCVPKDPHTAAQLRVRAAFGAASKAWGRCCGKRTGGRVSRRGRRCRVTCGWAVGSADGALYWWGGVALRSDRAGQVRWPSGRRMSKPECSSRVCFAPAASRRVLRSTWSSAGALPDHRRAVPEGRGREAAGRIQSAKGRPAGCKAAAGHWREAWRGG